MRVVIAGASSLGTTTARIFAEANHDVIVIDQDRDQLERLSESLDCGLVEGDCTLPPILREAGGEACDVLLPLTDSDQTNIICGIVGLSIGFERVVPQIAAPAFLEICNEVGLSDVVTPDEKVASGLLDLIERKSGTDQDAQLTGDLRLMRHKVSAALAGATISEAQFDGRCRIIALRRGEKESLAEAEVEVQKDDVLVLAVSRQDADVIRLGIDKLEKGDAGEGD